MLVAMTVDRDRELERPARELLAHLEALHGSLQTILATLAQLPPDLFVEAERRRVDAELRQIRSKIEVMIQADVGWMPHAP
jgi:hypothetical protein